MKACLILSTLLITNFPAYAASSDSVSQNQVPLVLSEALLDLVTAGGVSSMTKTDAYASGLTFAETETKVLTSANARTGNWSTLGKGTSTAKGNGMAYSSGTSGSMADTTGVVIQGEALAVGDDAKAMTKIWTRAIDTRYAEIAIGHVRSVACCGSDTNTDVQASSFTEQDFSISHVVLNEANTPRSSHAIGHVVIVSVSHP